MELENHNFQVNPFSLKVVVSAYRMFGLQGVLMD